MSYSEKVVDQFQPPTQMGIFKPGKGPVSAGLGRVGEKTSPA